MYWVGSNLGLIVVGILVAGKLMDKIFDVKCVNDRLMMIKLFIGEQIVAIAFSNAPQQLLAEDVKDNFCKDFILLFSKFGRTELVILGDDLSRYIGKDLNDYVNGYELEMSRLLLGKRLLRNTSS